MPSKLWGRGHTKPFVFIAVSVLGHLTYHVAFLPESYCWDFWSSVFAGSGSRLGHQKIIKSRDFYWSLLNLFSYQQVEEQLSSYITIKYQSFGSPWILCMWFLSYFWNFLGSLVCIWSHECVWERESPRRMFVSLHTHSYKINKPQSLLGDLKICF